MKSKQFCSVCKEWLAMEVVPTGDGEDDDGVVWYRCPQCQGFLPKLKGSDPAAGAVGEPAPAADAEPDPGTDAGADSPPSPDETPGVADAPTSSDEDDLPWDSPADMMASGGMPAGAETGEPQTEKDVDAGEGDGAPPKDAEPDEPVAEYAALLDQADQGDPRPYRPWDTYEVGDCIMHLAWEDCGVVVAKEDLPGGRRVIKCFFAEAGVVRLIEQAPR